jgi:hypothetical protein
MPQIPEYLLPSARAVILDCWAENPDDRPSFGEILERLIVMDAKVTADVNSKKVSAFFKKIEEWEEHKFDKFESL